MKILSCLVSKIKSFLGWIETQQASITLEITENGIYVIKAYGQYLIDSMTYNRDEAERNYQIALDTVTGKRKAVTKRIK
jgi:hypothetical protein